MTVEQLAQEIEALHQLGILYMICGLMFPIGSGVISFLITSKTGNTFIIYTPLAVGVIICILFSFVLLPQVTDQITELEIQKAELIRSYYSSLPCNDLRLNILDQMQKGNGTWIDFQKDYYNLNCETPLREEVLKLQETR